MASKVVWVHGEKMEEGGKDGKDGRLTSRGLSFSLPDLPDFPDFP
jgi:hypothetical protein